MTPGTGLNDLSASSATLTDSHFRARGYLLERSNG
jgi:hypothetical protein